MKPTYITGTNIYECDFQSYGFSQTIKINYILVDYLLKGLTFAVSTNGVPYNYGLRSYP
jgi:hypothetical protein